MRFELVILLVAGFCMANIYTDGKYMTVLLSWKKYYQMAGIAFGALTRPKAAETGIAQQLLIWSATLQP